LYKCVCANILIVTIVADLLLKIDVPKAGAAIMQKIMNKVVLL